MKHSDSKGSEKPRDKANVAHPDSCCSPTTQNTSTTITTLCTTHSEVGRSSSRRSERSFAAALVEETRYVVEEFVDEGRLPAKEIISAVFDWLSGVGEAIPLLAPVVMAFKPAVEAVRAASRNKAELAELVERNLVILGHIIYKYQTSAAQVDVSPLTNVLKDLKKLADSYRARGVFFRMFLVRSDHARIQVMNKKINHLVRTLNLGASMKVSEQVEELRLCVQTRLSGQQTQLGYILQLLDDNRREQGYVQASLEEMVEILRLQTSMRSPTLEKIAPAPQGAPVTADWHVARNNVVDAVRENLFDPEGPWMVGIVGQSGSGKTTAAAAIVGDKMGKVLPREGESHADACERLEKIRKHFRDGVLWLRVGRGAGSKRNLPPLMLQLARMVDEDVGDAANCGSGKIPTNQEGGTATTAYIRNRITSGNNGKGYRCLLVADDVYEPEVVEQLRYTGMRVLMTTRFRELVEGAGGGCKSVGVEKLSIPEAEAALRGAAKLRSNERLPQSAYDIMERCNYRAMYVGYVAKWQYLKGRKDERVWKQALDAIDRNCGTLVAEQKAGEDEDLDGEDLVADRHNAILRAGFDCLASDAMHSKLYLALAVMPDTHAFAAYEAAILLYGHEYNSMDLETAEDVVRTLERWAIVRVDGAGLYRMHDALREFAKTTLREKGTVHKNALLRWRNHLSSLDALRSVDLLVLLELWKALEDMGGEGWRVSRPYDKAVAEMDPADPAYFASIKVLASLYQVEGDLDGAEDLMLKVMARNDALPNANPLVVANALCWRVVIAASRGQRREAQRLRTRMIALVDTAAKYWEDCVRTGGLEESLALHTLGSLHLTAARIEEAEVWFRRALKTHEATLGKYHAQVGATLQGLALCLQHRCPERQEEANRYFHRAIDIIKMRRGNNSLEEASTLSFLAICELDAKRPELAEPLFRRALNIYEQTKMKPSRLEANALHSLGVCVRELGRWAEAQELLRRSLEIQRRLNEGSEPDAKVACTLRELAGCVHDDTRLGEVGVLFRSAGDVERERGLRCDDTQRAT